MKFIYLILLLIVSNDAISADSTSSMGVSAIVLATCATMINETNSVSQQCTPGVVSNVNIEPNMKITPNTVFTTNDSVTIITIEY